MKTRNKLFRKRASIYQNGLSGIKVIFLISFLSGISNLPGCSFMNVHHVSVIRIKGSDTMLNLNQLWAQEYMKTHSGVSVYSSGGGSASGLKSLIKGEVDICASSRTLRAEEAKLLAENFGSLGISFIIAKDALSIYLNQQNPVKDITISQLGAIFSGGITNWKDVGGDDAPIHLLIRNPNSGTYLYFKEHILNEEEYSSSAKMISTTEEIVQEIAKDKYSIGYGGIGYGKQVYHCKINGILPSEDNVRNDSYPIARYLYFYTVYMPAGEIKNFLDWVLSPEGQKVVEKAGYIPLWR